jgi:hypothetical protein
MSIEILTPHDNSITGTCETCSAEPAACFTPLDVDDGAPLKTCWRCAHLLTHHEATFETLASERAWCACSDDDIFPAAPLDAFPAASSDRSESN